jgi:hypothetical protein
MNVTRALTSSLDRQKRTQMNVTRAKVLMNGTRINVRRELTSSLKPAIARPLPRRECRRGSKHGNKDKREHTRASHEQEHVTRAIALTSSLKPAIARPLPRREWSPGFRCPPSSGSVEMWKERC